MHAHRVIAAEHLMFCRLPMQCYASKKWHSLRPLYIGPRQHVVVQKPSTVNYRMRNFLPFVADRF
ncbi:hypothetical protein NW762_008781 [Fusarium torreyae]|uniref:Uncharacterized protein n=1 Tax=Fusarium torreyae TaxID=1237075 RepID=A0A9W8RW52_9HYPO|nr:hypothetical protein NW762_008781 [Fusarium torreyae]